jgi:ubiquinone/menaquinone biosynthesis C-methylase UbiE
MPELFDNWPDEYENWFSTPLGKLIKGFESNLILNMLKPQPGEHILDAGCGTGIFTSDIISKGASVTGLDISRPMLKQALRKIGNGFSCICADMLKLPFKDCAFDKTVTVTAIEFIQDAALALSELERVTKPGGAIVVATLNSLSPWAEKRRKTADKDGGIFTNAIFRSPDELAGLLPFKCTTGTAIHFPDDADPYEASEIEKKGASARLVTGAFAAVLWIKQQSDN